MDGGPTGTGIGQPVRRREDLRLLTGDGRYSDDVNLPGQAYAVMVRSPHAHALIRGDRHRGGKRGAGRAGGADRTPMCCADGLNPLPNIANTPPGRHQHREQGRLAGRPAASSRRSSAPRCAMSARSSPSWSRRASPPPRTPPNWSRSTTRCCRRSPMRSPPPQPGAPRGPAEPPEHHPRRRGRRRGRDRGGLRRRRACRPVRDLGAAHRRRADGAARRDRRIRPGDRTLHAPCRGRRRGQPAARPGDGARRRRRSRCAS